MTHYTDLSLVRSSTKGSVMQLMADSQSSNSRLDPFSSCIQKDEQNKRSPSPSAEVVNNVDRRGEEHVATLVSPHVNLHRLASNACGARASTTELPGVVMRCHKRLAHFHKHLAVRSATRPTISVTSPPVVR